MNSDKTVKFFFLSGMGEGLSRLNFIKKKGVLQL